MKSLKRQIGYFFLLGMLFLPFPFKWIPIQPALSQFFFRDIVVWIKEVFFPNYTAYNDFTSDSSSLYVLVLLLLFLSFLLAIVFKNKKESAKQRFRFIRTIGVYYLALQLLNYGFDKCYKRQFYLPEPNTLYTQLGNLDADIAFWSLMGSNYSFNLFMGLVEVLAGILLLSQRTRLLGFIGALGIFLHVVAINFCFDISLKIYSCFLLLLTVWQLFHHQATFALLFQTEPQKNLPFSSKRKPFWYTFLKVSAILFIFLETHFYTITNLEFNDDKVERPYLHGAYEVVKTTQPTLDWSRIFFHRRGFLIIQKRDESLSDFDCQIDKEHGKMLISDYDGNSKEFHFNYNETDSILTIIINKDSITTKALDWQSMPLLQQDFHWTVD